MNQPKTKKETFLLILISCKVGPQVGDAVPTRIILTSMKILLFHFYVVDYNMLHFLGCRMRVEKVSEMCQRKGTPPLNSEHFDT
jgi:hypothetical protein